MYPSSKQLITPPPSLKNILAEVTHQNITNLHGLLHPIVPVSSTINNQDLEMVNMLKIWKIDVNIHHHTLAHPCQRKFQLKWYILMSATPLIFFSLLFLPSTMSSTINSHELNVFRHAESVKTFMSTNVSLLKTIPTEVIYPICQPPPWSSPPCCSCRPQCRRPPAHMYLMLSDMLKV